MFGFTFQKHSQNILKHITLMNIFKFSPSYDVSMEMPVSDKNSFTIADVTLTL